MSYPCRLCNAATKVRFTKTVLGKYEIKFLECPECGSMQTEEPYWLGDSYAENSRPLDINAASRAVNWQRLLFMACRKLGLSADARLLDWGAGDGLLVRLLRDAGIDAYYYDPLADNQYAIGWEAEDLDKGYDVVTAFEVWEHLPNPADEIAKTLAPDPVFYVATTDVYEGQDETWPYLNLLTGRHVFFYSKKAIDLVAERHGYRASIVGMKKILLFKPDVSERLRSKVEAIVADRNKRLRQALFALIRKRSFAGRDRKQAEAVLRRSISQQKTDG